MCIVEINHYNFATVHIQEITIQGFSPAKIPISANILITINGSNLDISNPLLSRIEIVDTNCTNV